jgi:hypothetical protein
MDIYSLHRGRSRKVLVRIIPHDELPHLFQIEWPDIGLSDLTNLTRAKAAALEWAERQAMILDRKLPVARRLKSLDKTIVYSKTGNSPEHDNLLLPNGKKVSEVSTEELRPLLAKVGIENAHTDGRAIIVRRYAEFIGGIFNEAGLRAVRDFLEEQDNA